jgi:hypothetical protein
MPNSYDVGDVVRCTGTFTDADGNVVDPTAVTFKFEDPSGNETSYVYGTDPEVVRVSQGVYRVDVTIDESGIWYYRFVSTGTGAAASEEFFKIRPTRF